MTKKSDWFAINRRWLEGKLDYRFISVEPPPEGTVIHEFDEDSWQRCRELIAYEIMEDFCEKFGRFPDPPDIVKVRAYEPIAPRKGEYNHRSNKEEGGRFKCIIWWVFDAG